MEDAIKSIKAYLYDRESSPLTGAYFISWCIWNFKFLLVIFSSDPIRVKFLNIESYLFEPSYFFEYSQWIGPIWVYFIPLILALLYLVALPKFSIKIYEISLNNRKALNEKKQAIEDQELLTKEESIKIRREIYRVTEEYEAEIGKKNALISELKTRIEEIIRSNQENTTLGADRADAEYDDVDSKFHDLDLSNEAKTLLKEASLDPHGTVTYSRYVGGTELSSNNKNFIQENDRREISKWESALQELVGHYLLIERGHKGEIYEITKLGYEIADKIERS